MDRIPVTLLVHVSDDHTKTVEGGTQDSRISISKRVITNTHRQRKCCVIWLVTILASELFLLVRFLLPNKVIFKKISNPFKASLVDTTPLVCSHINSTAPPPLTHF